MVNNPPCLVTTVEPGDEIRERKTTSLMDMLLYFRCKFVHKMWGGRGVSGGIMGDCKDEEGFHWGQTDIVCQVCGREWRTESLETRKAGEAEWHKESVLWLHCQWDKSQMNGPTGPTG